MHLDYYKVKRNIKLINYNATLKESLIYINGTNLRPIPKVYIYYILN